MLFLRSVWCSNCLVKDCVYYLQNSFVVYKFKCQCDIEYVGWTNKKQETRIGQHVPTTITSGNLSHSFRTTQSVDNSAIGQNLLDNPDCADKYIDQFFLLFYTEQGLFIHHLKFLKVVYIKMQTRLV